MGWGARLMVGFQDGGTHVHPWLIQVDVWQNSPQYCKEIIFQSKKNDSSQLMIRIPWQHTKGNKPFQPNDTKFAKKPYH